MPVLGVDERAEAGQLGLQLGDGGGGFLGELLDGAEHRSVVENVAAHGLDPAACGVGGR